MTVFRFFFGILFSLLFVFFSAFSAIKKIPKFELLSEDGKIVSREDLKGKPSVLVFWSLNCSSCKKELPILNKFYQKYKDKLNFYAIVLFTRNKEAVKERKNNWSFEMPVLFGDSEMVYKYRVIGVPTIYFVNKDLTIFRLLYGRVREEKLKNLIVQLIKNNSQ